MQRIKTNQVYLLLIQMTVFAFCIINSIVHNVTVGDTLKIFLYQFFIWFLPGLVILRLLKIDFDDFSAVIALSYGIGAISSLVAYLLFMTLGFKSILPCFAIAEGIICTIYVFFKKLHLRNYSFNNFSVLTTLCFLVVFLAISTCAVSFVNTMPDEVEGIGYYIDWPFWVGNNIGFTKSFPSDSFRQIGTPFKYHYFSSILIAMVSLCTNVDINHVSFYYSSILAGIILIFSGFYFSSRVLKKKSSILILMLTILFTDGVTITFAWHTNICPFGFDYGYAYGMLSIALLAEIILKDRFNDLFVLSVLTLGMATGCKGPIGVVVLAAYGIATISFLLKKQFLRGIISGVIWLTTFIAIFYIFVGSHLRVDTSSGLSYLGGLGINWIVSRPDVAEIYESLLSAYRIQGDRLPVKLYSVWLYLYRANKAVITFSVIALIYLIKETFCRKTDVLLYSLMFSVFSGIFLAIYTVQKSGSEMYFLMGIYPMAAMAGIYSIEQIYEKYKSELMINGIMIIVLCNLGMSINSYFGMVIPKIREGIAVIRNRYTADDYDRLYADSLDYEIFKWLRDNTDENAVFALDNNDDIFGRYSPMLAGIFSERYVWNEVCYVDDTESKRRNTIVDGLETDTDSSVKAMKAEGVDYLLNHIGIGINEWGDRTSSLEEVFRNSHYIIYRID